MTENVHQRVCRRRPIVLDNQKGERRANDEAAGGWNKDDENWKCYLVNFYEILFYENKPRYE